ncbi:cytochrome C [Dyadobacter fanqingshengii]|uniref:Cytochrome C n=1 Tax=Dyadobacter fanqingshengii TaxID=2906443 RepID=A0A9X1P7Z6_9BACT|nr:cytochrome C [Dyadobacter fanqingshengii]MCF0039715.1 cytochrome C [Dyadobacter fanqingshengii]USJ38522.1 cytochrome C [Dyadobacter fanqingshengii]
MEDQSTVIIFIDDDEKPIGAFASPVNFELDTRKIADGKHVLKIVSKDPTGKEGIRMIPFEVRNGPAIAIEGMQENAVVDGIVPMMINAYGKGDQKKFLITGSESPQSIPALFWILLICFTGWSLYYLITYLSLSGD